MEIKLSIRASVRRTAELEREIAVLVEAKAPELLAVPGLGGSTPPSLADSRKLRPVEALALT